jgi:hypothetical protein
MRRDRASERRSNGAVVSDAVRAHSPLLKGVGRSGAGLGGSSRRRSTRRAGPDHKRPSRLDLTVEWSKKGLEPAIAA